MSLDLEPTRARRPIALALRILLVRLRFPAILAIAFLVVGRWESLRESWDRLVHTAPRPGQGAVSAGTEYFCPMDPGIVGDWPGKCPACNMALVRRKKGDAAPLPNGVIARMQVSPYRIQLAGIRTATASYRPLSREIEAVGVLSAEGSPARFDGEVSESDAPLVAEGQEAEIARETLPGPRRLMGKVHSLSSATGRFRVVIVVEDPGLVLRSRHSARAVIRVPMSQMEPFRSMPADPPPWTQDEPRAVYACPDHPEVVRAAPGRCPKDKAELERRPLAEDARVRWWCPMHPEVTAERPGAECKPCDGMKLVPRVISFRPGGMVLAVPEGAIVETGDRTIAYVEKMPGMFDGVEVVVGPRCGGEYPIIRGLEPGEKVAAAGAFLIDAETRLNPAVGAAYFGGKKD